MRGLVVLAAALAIGGDARAQGPRVWAGGGLALDPAFAALGGGADWFFTPALGLGVAAAHTLAGAGDQKAIERGHGFGALVGRLRAAAGPRLRLELLGGGGVARTLFGSPGAHTDWDPALALGGAVGLALPARFELALEGTTQVVLGARTGTRNPAHTSELVALVLRFGP